MTRSKRQEQKRKTREHLIEVAFGQFSKDGLINTKTKDIAILAGVSHGTVFAHFPTRDDLLIAVIEKFGSRITGRIHEFASKGSSVRDVLEAHLNGLMEFEPFYTRLVTEGPFLPSSTRNTIIMIQSAISFHLSQAIERERVEGIIRNVPLHLLFNTWVGLVHYYLANNKLFAPEGSVLKRYGAELLENYLILITEAGHGSKSNV